VRAQLAWGLPDLQATTLARLAFVVACVTTSGLLMPSSEYAETRPDRAPRAGRSVGAAAGGVRGDTPWAQLHAFGAGEPWDAVSAEALTRLYESEEGDLARPAERDRARYAHASARENRAPGPERGAESFDETWLEAHLSRLAKRLQDSLSQANPERSFGALNERLDAIEQRFSAALGRVAQRTDLDGLKSIESDVMELAAQLDRARDRLDQIGVIDDEVRTLARRLDEVGEQRATALEKLLRDCVAEWREGEQRTAGALHNLEEAINRLGDSVDAMEASKPAPDLSVPALAGSALERTADAGGPLSRLPVGGEWTPAPHFYHAMLDAADYAPRPAADEPRAASRDFAEAAQDRATLPAAAVEWSARQDLDRPQGGVPNPVGRQIAALRMKLRQSPVSTFDDEHPEVPPAVADGLAADAFRRTSLSLLLMAGAVILAGSTYFLYQALAGSAPPVRPAFIAPGAPSAAGKPEMPDPNGRRQPAKGAS
jgi:hypothetical protein